MEQWFPAAHTKQTNITQPCHAVRASEDNQSVSRLGLPVRRQVPSVGGRPGVAVQLRLPATPPLDLRSTLAFASLTFFFFSIGPCDSVQPCWDAGLPLGRVGSDFADGGMRIGLVDV